jgi:sn-glycerol 3-phosphate transport system permease protein
MAEYSQYKKTALFLIAPQLIVIFVFFIWPAGRAILESFYVGDAFGIYHRFAGLTNFIDLLQDPSFISAVVVTLVIAFFVTFITLSFGLLLAVLVNHCKKSQGTYKLLLLWPYAVAPAVAAMLWRFLFQPSIGWLATGLQSMGFEFNYLIHPKQALVVIVITASWQQLSYNFLFFLAALKAIPQSLLEAATLDGASAWRRFWQIIFPLMSPTTFFLLVMNLIYSFFDTFGIIDVLTNGGPDNKTTTLIYKVYKDGFVGMDPGSSAVQSTFLMVMVTGLILFQFRYLERKVHYS